MDNQECWYELLSPIRVLAGQQKTAQNVNISLDSDYITEDEEEVTMNTEEMQLKYHLKPLREQVLSQKLSQLSTNSHRSTEHLYTFNKEKEDIIPYYLAKESKSFEQVISHVSSNELIDELRQMALLIHQLSMINLEKSLWTTYLKSGTGQLHLNQMDKDNLIHPHLWSIQVQKIVRKKSPDNTDIAACLTYVTQHLDELDDKMKQYQTKYNMKKNQYLNYLPTIQTFVHQQLESTRLTTEQQIAIVYYMYSDHVFELKFLSYNPTQQQKQIVQKLTHAKYLAEIGTEEYHLLKYRISIEEASPTSLELPKEKFLKTIKDQSIRQNLHGQFVNIAQQAKKDMIQLSLSIAQGQMDRYQKEFKTKLEQFQLQQQSLPGDKRFNSNLLHLIEQHWKNISEAVNCFYKYKLDLVCLSSLHN